MNDQSAPVTIAAAGTTEILILDLLEWIGRDPRPRAEVLESWRTSCPRFPVWEDANDRGFIVSRRAPGRGTLVGLSAAGAEHLRKHRPSVPDPFRARPHLPEEGQAMRPLVDRYAERPGSGQPSY